MLLDTHALLWWLDDDAKLDRAAWSAIEDPDNDVFLSAASVWEIAIKRALAKIDVGADFVARAQSGGFDPLTITADHAVEAGGLPPHHGDPFDRMLVAQARVEGLTLVTRDPKMSAYDVRVLPA